MKRHKLVVLIDAKEKNVLLNLIIVLRGKMSKGSDWNRITERNKRTAVGIFSEDK